MILRFLAPVLAVAATTPANLLAQATPAPAAPTATKLPAAAPQPLVLVPAAPVATTEATGGTLIPAKTVVQIEVTETISSKDKIIGDVFALKLAEPLVIDGRTILPAGVVGRGEVTHAATRGSGGKAGELIVNARFLQCGDLRIPLGHFHYSVAGKSNVGGAFAAAQIIPFGQFMVSGHDAILPAGTSGTAQINADTLLSPEVAQRCAPAAG